MQEQPRSESAARRGRRGIRLNLLFKALILVLAMTIVPLAILGLIGVQGALDVLGDSSRRDLQMVAQLTATRLDQLFVDTGRMQGMIAANRLVCEALDRPQHGTQQMQRLQEMLDGIVNRNPDLALAYVADASGVCIVSTSGDMVGRDYRATREYMRRALAGEQYVSEMNMGITTREPGVFFSGPVLRRDQVIGAVVLKVRAAVIDRICNDVNASIMEGFAAVVDSRQVIISHPSKEFLYQSIGTAPAVAAAGIDPKLDYGVETIRSAGLEDVARELSEHHSRGNFVFTAPHGEERVAGYARLRNKEWTVLVVQPREVFLVPLRRLAYTYVGAFAGIGIVTALLATLATWALLRPVKALRAATARAGEGDWSARAKILSNDELGDLAQTFNEMMPRLQQHTKMQDSLRLAMAVQKHLLPERGPAVPGLDIDGANIAADETGGDYFDFIDLGRWQKGTVAVAVGDVTGHGVSAALLMATARAMLRSRATPPGDLAELMMHVNAHLCEDVPYGHFMTLMYVVVDRPAKCVRLVSAGHEAIMEYNPRTDQFRALSGNDLPLAVDRKSKFHEFAYMIEDDAILVLGTDGIWETCDAANEAYGTERLQAVVRANAHKDAKGIRQSIIDAVNAFRGAGAQMDDVTVVVVKLVPVPADPRTPADAKQGTSKASTVGVSAASPR